jgi:2-dehydropantoate 2-reductase
MRLTFVGAGAIGGVTGAHLIRAGHEVTFVDAAEEHVARMNADGLRIEGIRGDFTVPVRAISPAQMQGPLETVVLAVKAMHTETATRQIAPHLAPDGCIVSLQNGLNEETIAAIVGPTRTIGAEINWSADYLEPGRILHGGQGSFTIGELDGRLTPRVQQLRDAFAAFTDAVITDNIWGYLWSKHCLASINYFTALADADVADVLAGQANRRTAVALVGESLEVAERNGVRLEPFDGFRPDLMHPLTAAEWQAAIAMFDDLLDNLWRQLKRRTGMWRDLAIRKRKTEVDMRVTDLCVRGRALGLPMTLNQKLADMIHAIEDGQRAQSWANLEEIAALARALGHTGEASLPSRSP